MKHESEMSLDELKESALYSASFRLHKLGEWKDSNKHGASSFAECTACKDAGVWVMTKPPVNSTWVMGQAVAVTCKAHAE